MKHYGFDFANKDENEPQHQATQLKKKLWF
jgi:hypothetical protein